MGRVRRDARKGDRENGSLRHRSAADGASHNVINAPGRRRRDAKHRGSARLHEREGVSEQLVRLLRQFPQFLEGEPSLEFPGVSQPSLSGKVRSHLLNDSRGGWHHTKSDPASAIDDGFAIHENFVLAVAATDRFHLDSEFTTEPRRHTDGM
jgi:hypothetical protein